MTEINSKSSAYSWFAVLNNPEKDDFFQGLTPEQIVDKAIEMWMTKTTRSCGVSYEIGDGQNHNRHLHMALCDTGKTRFSAVKKLFPRIHLEKTQGTRSQVIDYLEKRGVHAEKGHTIIVKPKYAGDIITNQGRRTDLEYLEKLIADGYTPQEIFDINIKFRRFEKAVRGAYFRKKSKETPPYRPVEVIWHTGASGTGKSHVFVELVEQFGEENVYMWSDHSNGGLDMYMGEDYLFIDEFKGSIPFHQLLQLLDGYKIQLHARYENVVALYTTVVITSIFGPEEVYSSMVENSRRGRDSIQQLLRRIHTVVYHYKTDNGEFRSFSIPASEYVDYNDLASRAESEKQEDGFVSVSDKTEIPFL